MKRNLFRNILSWLIKPTCIFTLLITASTALAQTEEAKVVASDAAAIDRFGNACSIDADTAVVGAAQDNHTAGTDAGSAYVYQRDHGGVDSWGQVKILRPTDLDVGDKFGICVSISQDTIIVGSLLDDDGSFNSGSAYIFGRNTGGTDNWGQIVKINASDAAEGDRFGSSVAISGDFAVVGAEFEEHGGNAEGKAYVFYRDQGGSDNWGQVARLTASDAANSDFFAHSLSIDGDVIVVGAWQNDAVVTNSGSAYVFVKPGGGWSDMTETAQLTASDAGVNDQLGFAVAISGDVIVAGAAEDDDNGGSSGSAYVFVKDSGGWDDMTETAKLTASDGESLDHLAASVAIDGDGILLGAPSHGLGGATYVFLKPSGGWSTMTETTQVTASDAAASDAFGSSVAISEDLAITGATLDDDGGSQSGSAYVFDGICPCPWDLDESDQVDILDLLDLLSQWGDDPAPADFDDDGDVDTSDLLALFANWYNCPCVEGPQPLSFEDELDDACISEAEWDDYEDIMKTGTEAEKDNYDCWMRHYIEECDRCTCLGSSGCPGADPFD